MSNDNTSDDFDAEIDGLALEIEMKIQDGRQTLDEVGDFDPKYRRMAEADPVELFS